jgi:hypothetical protein
MTQGRQAPVLERLLERIDTTVDGCWVWPGAVRNTYGVIGSGVGKKVAYTHRVAYEGLIGPIPEGLVIDHLCRNRLCCNPKHLEPVTRYENCARGLRGAAHLARIKREKNAA